MNLVEYEETATNKVLEEIDTSINATVDLLMTHNKQSQHNRSSDSYETYETEEEGVEVSPGPGGQVHLILPPPPPDPRMVHREENHVGDGTTLPERP